MFNHEAFIYCAQNYSTEAGNVRDACEHNANIAWQANRYRDSQTWMAIKLFYSDMAEPAIVLSQGKACSFKYVPPFYEISRTSSNRHSTPLFL